MDSLDMKSILAALNQRPIAFYPVYRQITGSLTGALLLSQIMYWWAASGGKKFYKTDADLMNETLMTPDELRGAKSRLKKLNFLRVTVEGLPAKTFYEVDSQKLAIALSGIATESDKNGDRDESGSDGDKTENSSKGVEQGLGYPGGKAWEIPKPFLRDNPEHYIEYNRDYYIDNKEGEQSSPPETEQLKKQTFGSNDTCTIRKLKPPLRMLTDLRYQQKKKKPEKENIAPAGKNFMKALACDFDKAYDAVAAGKKEVDWEGAIKLSQHDAQVIIWNGKELKNLQRLKQLLEKRMATKKIENTYENLRENFRLFLESVVCLNDKFILSNFTPSTLLSQFNNIILKLNQKKNGVNTATSSVGRGVAPEILAAAIARSMQKGNC